eukprot:IDg2463t1
MRLPAAIECTRISSCSVCLTDQLFHSEFRSSSLEGLAFSARRLRLRLSTVTAIADSQASATTALSSRRRTSELICECSGARRGGRQVQAAVLGDQQGEELHAQLRAQARAPGGRRVRCVRRAPHSVVRPFYRERGRGAPPRRKVSAKQQKWFRLARDEPADAEPLFSDESVAAVCRI